MPDSNPTLVSTPNQAVIAKILSRQLIINILDKIRQLPTPFENGEKLVLMGSAVTLQEGTEHPDLAPWKRLPSDMDLYLLEPNGESFADPSKHALQETLIKKVLEPTAESLNCEMHWSDGEERYGSKEYTFRKSYSADEVLDILKRPDIKEILRKNKLVVDEDKIRTMKIPEAKVALQYFMYPTSFSKPLEFATIPPDDPSLSHGKPRLQVMRDDSDNFIALKLARLYCEPEQSNISMAHNYYEKITDLFDIHSELKLRARRTSEPLDMERLKLLTLSHLAYKERDLKKVNFNSINPDIGDNLKHMMESIERIHMARVPEKRVAEIARTVDALSQAMFPERTEKPMPLSQAEKQFHRDAKRSDQAVKALGNGYKKVFEKDPGLTSRIPMMYFLRPSGLSAGKETSSMIVGG